jgi:hypothetical protein
MTTIEQMNALRNEFQQKLEQKAERDKAKRETESRDKVKRDYNALRQLMNDNVAFKYILNYQYLFASFSEFIDNLGLDNKHMDKLQFELLYTELKYTDIDFFRAFMSFDKQFVRSLEKEDRNCSVCFGDYKSNRPYYKFKSCTHLCCVICYCYLPIINRNKQKQCVICRQIEA